MAGFKKFLFWILLVEVQIVLVLLALNAYHIYGLDRKVYNTNRFLFDLQRRIQLSSLDQSVDEYDLAIGSEAAPLTLFMYSRRNCLHCISFFRDAFPTIHEKYIKSGKVRFVIRPLVSENQIFVLKETIGDFCSNQYGSYLGFQEKEVWKKQCSDSLALGSAILGKSKSAFKIGIFRTPSFIIEGQIIIGYGGYDKLESWIERKLQGQTENVNFNEL